MTNDQQREELAISVVGLVVNEISGMAEFMAKELERVEDKRGAEVIRLFKDTMNESFMAVLKEKVKMQ
jgi:hypothetical protein